MKILIKKVKIIDAQSPYFNETKDILIEDGRYVKIADLITDSKAKLIQGEELYVSQGWVDLKAHFCDPGEEHKEDLQSGLQAAAFGGYTHICTLPSTIPVVDNKSQVKYQLNQNPYYATQLHPIGAVTKGMEGNTLAELYDLFNCGVRLYSDDENTMNSGITYRALLYIKNFGGRIISFPQDKDIVSGGMINEGATSTQTGLKANPSISEIIQLQRDLRLLAYTESSLHVTGISAAESVALIRKAKDDGLDVTCDVHAHQLIFNEENLIDFDSNHKVNPPYRRESDRIALWEGLKDGTIDTIVSNHRPQDKEEKDIEFDNAAYGNITLQTVFSSLLAMKEANLQLIVDKLAINSRIISTIEHNPIAENNKADLTIFSTTKKWDFSDDVVYSKCFNTPFLNKKMKGLSIGIINNGQLVINEL